MTKLRLKRTPAEEEERTRRRAYKEARRKRHGDDEPSRKKQRTDYDTIRAELEEARFREKMQDALDDDERLDGINTRFNDYIHIPDRWSRDEHDLANPQYMDDDEYAEWMRQGMWKKKHAREHEEQAKRDAEKAARKKREREIKQETSRMERLAREQEKRRRREGQRQQEEEHRREYEEQWKELLDPRTRDDGPLTFWDIPWPLFSFAKRKVSDSVLRLEEITPEAIAAFLLPDIDDGTPVKNGNRSRRNRDKLKETLLRFHPDKFEGRIMHRICSNDTESVRDVVGQVARVLNALMNDQSR